MTRTLLNSLKILWLPVLELVALRLCFSRALQLHIGFPGFTDYELLLPAPMGFMAFIWALEQNGGISWKFSLKKFLTHSSLLALFLGLSVLLKSHTSSALILSWWILLTALVLSGLLLFVNVKSLFKNPGFWSIAPSAAMIFSLILYFKWGGNIFENTLPLWALSLKKVFLWFGLTNAEVFPMVDLIQVHHPQWTIHIGRGCAGFDGLIFFTGAFCIFAPIYWTLFRPLSWGIFFISGVCLFAFLNFFRILFLFTLGICLMHFMPQKNAIDLTLKLFHVHSGYLLYALGLCTYFQTILAISKISLKKSKEALAVS